jgi:hypothetical protein
MTLLWQSSANQPSLPAALFITACALLMVWTGVYYALWPERVYQAMLDRRERPSWTQKIPLLHFLWYGYAPDFWPPVSIRIAGIVCLLLGLPFAFSGIIYLLTGAR